MSLSTMCLCLASLAAAAGTETRPNLVVVLVDDMGMMDTSVPFLTDAAGRPQKHPLNEFYRTPQMERLAGQGIRFNQFYAMSVCSPTRVALMTGQNAARHRTTNWINPEQNNGGPQGPPEWNWRGLNESSITLAGLLQRQNYTTIHVGKGHFGARHTPGEQPLNLGFDANIGGAAFGAPASYYGMMNYGNAGGPVKKTANHAVPGLEKYHGTETFLTEALTQAANDCVTSAVQTGRPFFLYFAQYAVHAPFHSDPRFAAHYANSGKPPQAQAFATLIEGMDKSLGDVLDHLEQLGVAENTLVFFLGDNGSDAPLGHQHAVACAAPLRGKKGAHYEGGMRVPFIAAWAKPQAGHPLQQKLVIPAGTIQSQVANVTDLFPTILTLTGIDNPRDHIIDGRPLQRLLTGARDPDRSETFLMHYPHAPHRSDYWTSLRDGDWKVIYHYFPTEVSGNSHYQLFNLREDPYEQTDRAQDHPAVLQTMMQKLIAELERHAAVYPVEKGTRTPQVPRLP